MDAHLRFTHTHMTRATTCHRSLGGEKIRGVAVSRILASRNTGVKPGDLVNAMCGWTEVAIVDAKLFETMPLPSGARVTNAISRALRAPLPAKSRNSGARVGSIAGSGQNCARLHDELCFEAALNYKSESFAKDFRTRRRISSMFTLTTGYNAKWREVGSRGIRNLFQLTSQRIRMEGFTVFDLAAEFAEARREIGRWLAEGKIKRKETVAKGGQQEAEKAITNLFEGGSVGKSLVEVKAL
ncbi:hypothetical protein DL771_012464 [Monosporascus sp. 5C6A]|nr:hypothetical protein DL771_012464 [Monosporascus sp. 5C6A]